MRSFTQRFAIALALALAFSVNAQASDHFYDALALSIENFNGAHAKDLKSWGPEHKLMYDALLAVEEQIPAVKGISRLGYIDQNWGANPFSSLSRELFISKYSETPAADSEERILAQRFEAQIADLTEGCPFERKTTIEETDLGYTEPSVRTSVETTYQLESTANKKCKNALTKQLVSGGINLVTLIKREAGYGDYVEVRLSQRSNVYRDMAFVKNQLLKNEALRELVSELQVGDIEGTQVIGKSSDIRLVETTGAAALTDSFRLSYWKGWGDCPAGCISGHNWEVEVTPLEGGAFKVELVSDSGDAFTGDVQF